MPKGKPGYMPASVTKNWATANPADLVRSPYPSLDLGLIRKWVHATSTTSKGNSSTGLLRNTARPAMERIRNWVGEYKTRERFPGSGFYAFRSDWLTMRVWIDLQTRLAVEAVLWERGPPFSQLVTGFRPYGAVGTRHVYSGL